VIQRPLSRLMIAFVVALPASVVFLELPAGVSAARAAGWDYSVTSVSTSASYTWKFATGPVAGTHGDATAKSSSGGGSASLDPTTGGGTLRAQFSVRRTDTATTVAKGRTFRHCTRSAKATQAGGLSFFVPKRGRVVKVTWNLAEPEALGCMLANPLEYETLVKSGLLTKSVPLAVFAAKTVVLTLVFAPKLIYFIGPLRVEATFKFHANVTMDRL
jgi:hypothetical protein